MIGASRCPHCGAELPEQSPPGVCPACLLRLGLSGTVPAYFETPSVPLRRKRHLMAIAATAVVAIVAAMTIAIWRPALHPHVVRFQIPVPDEATFALSPDGAQLAYSGDGHLWIRSLDTFTARDLSGAEGAQH